MNRTVAILLVAACVLAAGCIADQRPGAGGASDSTTTNNVTTTGPPPSTGTGTTTGGTPTETRTSGGSPTTERTTTEPTTSKPSTTQPSTAEPTTTEPTTTRATTSQPTTTEGDPGGDGGGSLPPGVSGGDLSDPETLFGAHLDALAGSSYRMAFDAAGSGATVTEGAVRTDGDAVHLSLSAEDSTLQTYTEGDATLQRTDFRDRTGYAYFGPEVSPPIDDQFFVERSYVRLVLLVGSFEVAGETTRDGRRLVELRATDVTDPSPLAGNVTLESLDATVLVDADGRIHELQADVAGTASDGGPLDGQFSYEVGAVEGEIPPDWTDQVPRVEATLHEDGRVLELTHRGGPALGATTEVQFESGPEGALGESLGPGESVYVTVSGGGVSASRERPSVGADARRFDSQVTLTSFASGPTVRITVDPDGDDG